MSRPLLIFIIASLLACQSADETDDGSLFEHPNPETKAGGDSSKQSHEENGNSFDSLSQQNNSSLAKADSVELTQDISEKLSVIEAHCGTPYSCLAGIDELTEEEQEEAYRVADSVEATFESQCGFVFYSRVDSLVLLELEFQGYTYTFKSIPGTDVVLFMDDEVRVDIYETSENSAFITNKDEELQIIGNGNWGRGDRTLKIRFEIDGQIEEVIREDVPWVG